jgi:hypothetical protein
MAQSVLAYRVYRLRRLIGLNLACVALAIGAGLWFVPGFSALQVTVGIGLFSILAVAQIAMILLWPRDGVAPMVYAAGLLPTMAAAIPLGAALIADPASRGATLTGLLLFGPLVWLLGVPLLGWVILKPLDLVNRRNFTLQASRLLPLPLPSARDIFFGSAGKRIGHAVTGEIGWDGMFTETVTERVAGPDSGQTSTRVTVNRLRILEEDALSQGLIIMAAGPEAQPEGRSVIVMRQVLSARGDQTHLHRQFHIESAAWSALLAGWLGDMQQDSITSRLDAAMGQPSRAIVDEPYDSMWGSLARWLRWHKPQPGA